MDINGSFRPRRGHKADLDASQLKIGELVITDDTNELGVKAVDGTMWWFVRSVDLEDLDTHLTQLLNNSLDTYWETIYPIGSIYLSVNSANPGTIFGGTWVAWGQGRVPVSVDTSQAEFNAVEKTGGEKTHKLSVSEMPSHNHTQTLGGPISTVANSPGGYVVGSANNSTTTSTGGDGYHNNLQPYITCYMWKRTA